MLLYPSGLRPEFGFPDSISYTREREGSHTADPIYFLLSRMGLLSSPRYSCDLYI
jgi:hypothetical protein